MKLKKLLYFNIDFYLRLCGVHLKGKYQTQDHLKHKQDLRFD
jgi:hypothetical protein